MYGACIQTHCIPRAFPYQMYPQGGVDVDTGLQVWRDRIFALQVSATEIGREAVVAQARRNP